MDEHGVEVYPGLRLASRYLRSDVFFVKITGELDLATAPHLQAFLAERTATQPAYLVLDLSQVTFMASAGLHVVREQRGPVHVVRLDTDGPTQAVVPVRPDSAVRRPKPQQLAVAVVNGLRAARIGSRGDRPAVECVVVVGRAPVEGIDHGDEVAVPVVPERRGRRRELWTPTESGGRAFARGRDSATGDVEPHAVA